MLLIAFLSFTRPHTFLPLHSTLLYSTLLQPTRSEQKINKILLHVLEKLDLPGISQLDLTAALLQAGLKSAKDDPLAARLSAIDAAEEAELWSQLNASEGGNRHNSDPYVNFKFKF